MVSDRRLARLDQNLINGAVRRLRERKVDGVGDVGRLENFVMR